MKVNYLISKLNENNNEIEFILESELSEYKNSCIKIKSNNRAVCLLHKDIYILSNRMKDTINNIKPKLNDIVTGKLDINMFNFNLDLLDNKISIQFSYDNINRKIYVNFITSNQYSSITFINQLPWLSFNYVTDILIDIVKNWSILEQNSIILHNITYNYNTNVENTIIKENMDVVREESKPSIVGDVINDDIYKDILNFKDEDINVENIENDISNIPNHKQPQYNAQQIEESILDMF